MTYEELLVLSESENLIVKEKNIPGYGGRLYKNRIAISQSLSTQAEKSCILAEEIGHYHTTIGNILDQSDVSNRKQELRARLYGYDMQIGLIGIIKCYKHHCRSIYEMAEYLQVTEEYLKEALDCYRMKYGERWVPVDHYSIRFVPELQVMEFWN